MPARHERKKIYSFEKGKRIAAAVTRLRNDEEGGEKTDCRAPYVFTKAKRLVIPSDKPKQGTARYGLPPAIILFPVLFRQTDRC